MTEQINPPTTQPNIPTSVSASATRPLQDAAIGEMKLENQILIESLEHRFKGELYNPKLDQWEAKGERIVNTDDGVNIILSFLEPLTNKAITLSDMEPAQISGYMTRFSISVALTLANRAETDFDNDIGKYELVETIINVLVGASVLRARNAGERASLAENIKEVQSFVYGKNKDMGGSRWPQFLGGK
tara:strand:- start:1029 stop:1592 length:564 start_codon:yes stop_codon:yes gene_type:complete